MLRRFTSQFLGMNSSIVYRQDAGLLIDPGVYPSEIERIKKFIAEKNIKQIAILLTHTHGDHISGWNYLREYPAYAHQVVANKPEAVRENDVRYLKGMFKKQSIQDVDFLTFPEKLNFVEDHELIEIPPFPFEFFHTPGHSTDSCTIVVPEKKLIFSGDMLIQTTVPFILHSTLEYWQSLKILKETAREYDLTCLIPGHSKLAKSGSEILSRIEKEQKYLYEIISQGLKISKLDLDEDSLYNHMIGIFPEYRQLHPHQINVKTFIREIEAWQNNQIELNEY